MAQTSTPDLEHLRVQVHSLALERSSLPWWRWAARAHLKDEILVLLLADLRRRTER